MIIEKGDLIPGLHQKTAKEVPTGYGLMHNKQQLIAMIINALIIDDSL